MNTTYSHRTDIDPMDPMRPTWSGTISRDVEVGGVRRRVTYYIPEIAMAATAGVMLLPPGGVSAEKFLEKSSWRQLADTEECKEKFILCVLESGPEGWNTHEAYGLPDGEIAYVHTACLDFARRDLFCVHESKYYMVGYKDGGAIAQMAAMYDPAFFAGIAAVESPPVSDGYRAQAGSDWCLNLDGFEDPDHHLNLRKGQIPLPAWLIAGSEEALCQADLEYWKTACGADACRRMERDTTAWLRETPPADPVDQDKEAHRVWVSVIPGAAANFGFTVNRRIWKDFLYRVRRWMSEPGGSLRMTRDPVRDLGCEYHYEPVGGWMREWYVYVPQQVRENPHQSVPVVFISHGYTCSGEIYLGNSEWNRVADRYGFLVIAATGPYDYIQGEGENNACKFENTQLPAWNIFGKQGLPDEIAFFRHMLADVKTRYQVDEERIYATGHSWGSMMTQYLGMAMPEVFAAIAPCSGVLFDEHDKTLLKNPQVISKPACDLPVWMFVGEREPWLFPHFPEGENTPARSIRLWWQRNHMEGDAPDTFREGWVQQGRWNDRGWDKNGIPMIRYSWITDLPHATMPEMSFRIWEDFFSKLRRDHTTGKPAPLA